MLLQTDRATNYFIIIMTSQTNFVLDLRTETSLSIEARDKSESLLKQSLTCNTYPTAQKKSNTS